MQSKQFWLSLTAIALGSSVMLKIPANAVPKPNSSDITGTNIQNMIPLTTTVDGYSSESISQFNYYGQALDDAYIKCVQSQTTTTTDVRTFALGEAENEVCLTGACAEYEALKLEVTQFMLSSETLTETQKQELQALLDGRSW